MTAYYLDTSGLIKRYVTESGSSWVRRLFQPEDDHFFITCRLTMPEVYSALARRLREGSVSKASYDLRANDAVQLASALIANHSLAEAGFAPLFFLSADKRLTDIAVAEGLSGENPNNYS
jgi:uncharacterized protein